MTDFESLLLPDRGEDAHILTALAAADLEGWIKGQPQPIRSLVAAHQFKAKAGQLVIIPADRDEAWGVVFGAPEDPADPWALAHLAKSLPEGKYRFANHKAGAATLGWLLAQHSFTRYKKEKEPQGPRILLTSDASQIENHIRLAQAVAMVRDLVDTPAEDMGPAELEAAARQLANSHNAQLSVTSGVELQQHYPMIHAVGRAAIDSRQPRLVELHWGQSAHPAIAIVGKGIVFDTGGLDLKPSSAMLNMKKDMGGAAHALALASLIMSAKLPVRLHLLLPIAENAVAGNAFRPGDILQSRKGLSVEIGNTDAEGRLVLGDALHRACEDKPDLVIDFATLTGAARVALGPDIPAMFANQDALADDLLQASRDAHDPLWRLPLWKGYADMLKSSVADINNAGEGGMAGAVTAALFLQNFIEPETAWVHIDTFAWRPSPYPVDQKAARH